MGRRLNCVADVTGQNDDEPTNNSSFVQILVTGSYDPNDKKVLPAGDIPPAFVVDSKEFLNYKVRFQNSGTDTAFNIRIEDQLDTNLDISTLRMIGASHDYRLEIDSTGKSRLAF